MKNRLLILLAVMSFLGCNGQDFVFKQTVDYMNASYTYSGSLPKESQLTINYCSDSKTYGQKYDIYAVYSKDFWGDDEWEDDVFVLHGEDPSDLTKRFSGTGTNKAYIFYRNSGYGNFYGVEFKSTQGRRLEITAFECHMQQIETLREVTDGNQKYNQFYSYCSMNITNSVSVDIYQDRAWVVRNETYYNGGNLYRRLNTKNQWIKIDPMGYIVDRIVIDCEGGDRLVCTYPVVLPINSNSMLDVASKLNMNTGENIFMDVMGARIGLIPPITFPDDFQGYQSNNYVYIDGIIDDVTGCVVSVPSASQVVVLYMKSDSGMFSEDNFCQGINLNIQIATGATTFVQKGFCSPPYSDKGDVRIELTILQNGLSSSRSNTLTIYNDNFSYTFTIFQTGAS